MPQNTKPELTPEERDDVEEAWQTFIELVLEALETCLIEDGKLPGQGTPEPTSETMFPYNHCGDPIAEAEIAKMEARESRHEERERRPWFEKGSIPERSNDTRL